MSSTPNEQCPNESLLLLIVDRLSEHDSPITHFGIAKTPAELKNEIRDDIQTKAYLKEYEKACCYKNVNAFFVAKYFGDTPMLTFVMKNHDGLNNLHA